MEENKHYQIYTESIHNLAGSIVIKSSAAANGVNDMTYAYALAPYEELDPTTWKYYQNICGIYYPSDKPMYITSMDTLEQVLFSKETLVHHRATARAYAFGTTYYQELVARYPDQEQLIRGILYPADMQEAIDAPDGTILAYPKELVEETEPSLIPMLQEWIFGYLSRWHNVQYANIDNLYNAAMYAVMFAAMPGAIENIRLKLTRTSEAHSYHVQQYLSSNSKLGQYIPYMPRSLQMYFYRNIRYIQSHAGTNEMLDELIQKCLTERNIPLAHFTMLHSTENMPEQLKPKPIFYKNPLNTLENIDNRYIYNLTEVLDIQDPLAAGNSKYRTELQASADRLTTNAVNPNIPTKLMQSAIIDYTDSEKFRMADIVLNHWLWLSYNEIFRAVVTFTIPASGITLSLTAKDAFIFYAYALVKGYGFEMNNLPLVVANRVQPLKRVPLETIQEVVPERMRTDERLLQMQSSIPTPYMMISIDAFRNHCLELFKASNQNWFICCREESAAKRGYLEAASARLWLDANIDLAEYPNQTYADWFESRNILVNEYTQEQLAEIATIILKEAVGDNLASSITLKDIQAAMCDIILRLSSYSLQIDRDINAGPVVDVGQVQLRIDEESFEIEANGNVKLELPQLTPENTSVDSVQEVGYELGAMEEITISQSEGYSEARYDLPNISYSSKDSGGITSHHVMAIGVGITPVIGELPPNPRNLPIVPGIEHFLTLSLEQQIEATVDTWAR